jgi:hypothetical protein
MYTDQLNVCGDHNRGRELSEFSFEISAGSIVGGRNTYMRIAFCLQ